MRRLITIASVALAVSLISTWSYAQVDPRTGLLEQVGFEALNAGDAARAADAFRQAIASDPKNAHLYLGAGVAALLQRRDEEAKTALERAVALDPKLAEARQFLGQAYYRLGDLRAAIAAYEAIDSIAPDLAHTVSGTLDRWRYELALQGHMRQSVGNHFVVSYEGPAQAELGSQALESLDRAYWRIGQVLGMYPAKPVPVVLYTSEQFRDITRSPSWAAGAYDGTIRLPMRGALQQGGELDRVLAHEFTHALLRSLCTRPIPTWLNEGLATALESDDLTWARSRTASAPHAPSLAALAGPFGKLNGNDAELAYAFSAVAAAELLNAAGGIAIANLIRDLDAGADFETAFGRRMPWMFADFAASVSR